MKKINDNRIAYLRIGLAAAAIIGMLSFSLREHKNKPQLNSSDERTDEQFLIRAAEIDLQEIQLGRLAQQKGVAIEAKELGETMEKEHTQLLSDLTTLAKKNGISLPTSVSHGAMKEYNELKNKSEKRFSEEYCELVIKEHREAVGLFEMASKKASDSEIRSWAATTVPALKMYLTNARLCKERCEKM